VLEVLAAIGRQAGLRIRMEAGQARPVTAQFTVMAVEQGLRRLLRAAALSYALEYTPGPGPTATLHTVRVFGAAPDADREGPSPEALAQAGAAPVRVASARPPAGPLAAEAHATPAAMDPEPPELDPEAPDTSAPDLTHDWQD
jgi:hypothetical protein